MGGLLILLSLALVCAVVAWCLPRALAPSPAPPLAVAALSDRLDRLLPQTQCRQCLFDGCRPYAEAMARNEADINRCPPGGDSTIRALARELGRPPIALDPKHGTHGPLQLARIDESRCIGCRLCIAACPVDAIVGAPKLMHTVLREDCTGCELCLPPCPVDCIDLIPAPPVTHSAASP